jgi:hypothetical protein
MFAIKSLARLGVLCCAWPLLAASSAGTPAWVSFVDPHVANGARYRVLEGKLDTPGKIVYELELPAEFDFPAHFHDTKESLTVLAGAVWLGGMDGQPLDRTAGRKFGAASTHVLPARTPHWGYTRSQRALVRIRTTGPYSLHWVDDRHVP